MAEVFVLIAVSAIASALVLFLPRKEDRVKSLSLPENPSTGQNPFDVDLGSGEEQS